MFPTENEPELSCPLQILQNIVPSLFITWCWIHEKLSFQDGLNASTSPWAIKHDILLVVSSFLLASGYRASGDVEPCSKVQVFLSPMKPKIQHHCHHFEQYSATRLCFHDVIPSKRVCPNGFQQTKHAPNSKNDSSEDSEEFNGLEKYILLTFWRMQSQLQIFLLTAKYFD